MAHSRPSAGPSKTQLWTRGKNNVVQQEKNKIKIRTSHLTRLRFIGLVGEFSGLVEYFQQFIPVAIVKSVRIHNLGIVMGSYILIAKTINF